MDTNTPIVISRNEDFLALAPWAVGFQIEESVVMLGCGGPRSQPAPGALPTGPVPDAHVRPPSRTTWQRSHSSSTPTTGSQLPA